MTDLCKIDALIAEHVMGVGKMRGTFVTDIDQETRTLTLATRLEYPRYSASIEAAWEVVEKLNAEGFWFNLSTCDDRTFTADFSGDSREYSASAPYVICLAALKAKGVEVEGESSST